MAERRVHMLENEVERRKEKMIGSSSVYVLYVIRGKNAIVK